MTINVTKEDIDNATFDTTNCPVAKAISRVVKCCVGCGHFTASWGGGNHACDLPEQVTNFIKAFDSREPVKPFSFELVESDIVS